jgi:hypothetical protein
MKMVTVVLLGLVTTAQCVSAPLTVRLDDRGVVELADGAPLAKGVLNMHAPEWTPGGVEWGQARAPQREGDLVTGAFSVPAPATGAVEYTVTGEQTGEQARLAYTARFTEATGIWGLYVSFMLPCARFEGKRLTVLPSGDSAVLPAQGGALSVGGPGSAVTVEVGDGQVLVLASDAQADLSIQDGRQYGMDTYEVRFHLYGRGRVAPQVEAARQFVAAVTSPAEAAALAATAAPATTLDPSKPFVMLKPSGWVRVGTRDAIYVEAMVAIHGVDWSYAAQDQATVQLSGDTRARYAVGSLAVPSTGEARMDFVQKATALPDGGLGLAYKLSFPQPVRLNGYQVSFVVPLRRYAGATIKLGTPQGEKSVVVGETLGDKFLHAGPVTSVAVAPGRADGFKLRLDEPSNLLVQDGRGWGGTDLELRFNFRRAEAGDEVPAGESVQRAFTLSLNSPLQMALDDSVVTNQTDTSAWIPYTLPWDSCPVDMSFLSEKPAGKHGFVAARNGEFVLADSGQPIRFWGTCFSAGANFPSHEQAEKIARRLARFGVNIVRTHHADAVWAERCFFPRDRDDTRSFDAESLDRFDYLLYCLKQEGIYIYLDQLVNRSFKTGDGVDAVADLGVCGKPYSNFDPRLIELQQEFSRNLWTHVNPYTGLAYKDDPAVALMEFANENDLFAMQVTLEPYRTRFEAQYRAWATERGEEVPAGKVDFTRRTDLMMRFLEATQRAYYTEMTRFLRDEVGVRVPMTGSNWSINSALLAALRDMPYTDSHTYWGHPAGDGSVPNLAMVAAPGTVFGGLAFQKVPDKPFFVSEWDEPWPNEWRSELPCWMAAIASLQSWNGLTVYTYRHSSSVPVDTLTGAFETFNDPARFGLFPAAAAMFRRGDVAPARSRTTVAIPEEMAVAASSPGPWNIPAFRALPEITGLQTAVTGTPPNTGPVLEPYDEADEPEDVRASDTGQLWRSIKQRVGKVDSPRSQAVYGFLREAGTQTTTDLRVDCASDFATIAVTSLSDAPIGDADRLLLTAVGRAENTGFRYNLLRSKGVTTGQGPILVEPIRASIALRTDKPNLRVWAIGPDGTRTGSVPATWEDGLLRFQIGPDARTMYYAIEAG